MKKNLVILGNQFLCEKRMLNIVQRTIVMDEDAIDVYIHNHHLHKDQRAIVVDIEMPVRSGYIFTGDAFVDPVNCVKIPIEGNVEEEEFEHDTNSSTTPEIIRWLENIMTEIKNIKDRDFRCNENDVYDARTYLGIRNSVLHSLSGGFARFLKPKTFITSAGNLPVYKEPNINSEIVGYYKMGNAFVLDGLDNCRTFGLLSTGNWIKVNFKSMYYLGDVSHYVTTNDDTIKVHLFESGLDYQIDLPVKSIEDNTSQNKFDNSKVEEEEFTREEKLRILIDEDYTVSDIAKEFNVTTSAVYKWLKRYGIKRNTD